MSLTEWLGKHGVPGFRSKKKWKMVIAVPVYLFAALFLLLFILVALSGPTQQPNPAPQTAPTTQATDSTPKPTMSIVDLKSRAITVNYNDLMRYNQNYIGKIINFRGKIIQVTKNTDSSNRNVLRIAVGEKGIQNDVILAWYEWPSVLEGDTVDVWGEMTGLETYEALLGNKITIPALNVKHLELAPQTIFINYTTRLVRTIGTYGTAPKQGNVFLIITMNIKNKGYKEFNANPSYFKLIANNIKYDYASNSYSLEDMLDSIGILDNGMAKGSIAFEVPSNIQEYQIQYDSYEKYNIVYNKMN